MIVVAREPAADLRVGDVLVYQIPVLDHRVVSHRVVAISRDGSGIVVRTKGDANDAPDPWIARITDATVWRARFAVPYLGAVVRVLRSPGVHRTVLFAVPLALAMMWLLDIWRPEPAPSPGNA
jgi:signal peptidase